MAILLDKNTRAIIQGITGGYAQNQVRVMQGYGTNIVAGVTPGKSGGEVHGIPIFDTVREALHAYPANASVIYVSGPRVKDAALEALEAGIKLLVIATEGVPLHDAMTIRDQASKHDAWIIGPNSIGTISPGKSLLGTLNPSFATPGHVGLISRSGTLSMEVTRMLTEAELGQSTCVAIGGDRIIGKTQTDYLRLFEKDPDTRAVVLLGEIGGGMEQEAAGYIAQMTKPVVTYIVGRAAPAGKRMGHIGAMVSGQSDSYEAKVSALRQAGAVVAETLWDIPRLVAETLSRGQKEV